MRLRCLLVDVLLSMLVCGLTACAPPLAGGPDGPGECFRSIEVSVWEDANADGVHDAGENPLAGIEVGILQSGSVSPTAVETAVTSADGNATVDFDIQATPGCSTEGYVVGVVEAPAGYDLPANSSVGLDTVVANRNVAAFGLIPAATAIASATTTLAPTVTPTPTNTVPPSLTPTASPSPTETPSPTLEVVTSCETIMSRAQAESILGLMPGDPLQLEVVGGGQAMLCVFDGASNTASVELHQLSNAAGARTQFENAGSEGGEPEAGIGNEAYWSEGALQLSVLRGAITLYITMGIPDNARDQAIQVAQIAVVRIP